MESRHCTTEELIDILYGIDIGGEHVQNCPTCAARLSGMRETRRESLTGASFTDAELANQCRRWRARVEAERRPARPWRSWRVVAASVALAAVTLAILPRKAPPPVDDTRLFEDAFRKAMTVEPAPFAPIENLFERSPQ